MNAMRRAVLLNLLQLFDLLLMIGSFLLTTWCTVLESRLTLTAFLSMRIKLVNFIIFAALLLLWHLILSSVRLYDSRRMSNYVRDAIDMCKATGTWTVVTALCAFSFHIKMLSSIFLLILWGILTITCVASRLALRWVLERIRLRGRNLRNLLLVGSNARAVQFAKKIDTKPELGYRIAGFVDENWSGLEYFNSTGYSIVSDFDSIPLFVRDSVVDEVVIALPLRSLHSEAAKVVALCEEQGITSHMLSNIFDVKLARVRGEEFEGASLISNYTGAVEGWSVLVKRGIDIVVSAVLLVGLLPMLLVVAALIKLSSAGPVLFTQIRLGINKRKFKIYKFRTMTADAEDRIKDLEHLNEISGPVFKIKNDPRITAVGRLLRKTSIDELPQLFNVLKGDMSLVGPRPLPIRDYRGFNEDWQRRRFSVRPGITCLWQINGRSSVPFEKWMELDLQYIDKWSLRLDCEILLRTIPAVLKGYGAA